MPVRFGRKPRPPVRQIIQFLLDAPIFVVVGSDKHFDAEHDLHWLSDQNRTVPCTHEDCPWCPLPIREAAWVPCLAFSTSGRCWKEKVLPVHEKNLEFLNEPREHVVYQFVRRGFKNAPVKWQRMETQRYSQPFAGFDVTESLFKMWGMYANAKRTADKPGEDRPRLFDEPPAASEAG